MKSRERLPAVSVPSTRTRQRLRSRDWPRPPRGDPHVRLIAQLAQLAGPDMSVIASSSRPWASATFIGAQHRVIVQFKGENAPGNAAWFGERLPEAEFSIAGHIVADACVDEWRHGPDCDEAHHTMPPANPPASLAGDVTLRVTVLTVEDW